MARVESVKKAGGVDRYQHHNLHAGFFIRAKLAGLKVASCNVKVNNLPLYFHKAQIDIDTFLLYNLLPT